MNSNKQMTIDDLAAMIQRTMLSKEDAKNFATKDDLKNFATKDDIKSIWEVMATKDDIKAIRNEMATKEDIHELREEMLYGFSKLQTDLQSDINELSLLHYGDNTKMSSRVTRLEKTVFPND